MEVDRFTGLGFELRLKECRKMAPADSTQSLVVRD